MPVRPAKIRPRHLAGLIVAAYFALAYLLIPESWILRDRYLDVSPATMVTRTTSDIPGDPINVGLVGDAAAVLRSFALAGWDTADAITLKTAIEIGVSVLFDKPYPDAPVSTLMYDGRRQDLAFEKPVGTSPERRHHVRFWRSPQLLSDGSTLWLGSASFDESVGFSHDTGAITHHINSNVDAERDSLIGDLQAAGQIISTGKIKGVGETRTGRNGEGDLYVTDGLALIARLAPQPVTKK